MDSFPFARLGGSHSICVHDRQAAHDSVAPGGEEHMEGGGVKVVSAGP